MIHQITPRRVSATLTAVLVLASAGCSSGSAAGSPSTASVTGPPTATAPPTTTDDTVLGSTTTAAPTDTSTPTSTDSLQIVGLGDSYTSTQNTSGQTYLELYATLVQNSTGRTVTLTDLSNDANTTTRLAKNLRTEKTTREAVAAADIVLVSVGGNDSDPFATYPDGTCSPSQPLADCLDAYSPTFAANYEIILSEVEHLRSGNPTAIRVTSADNPFVGWSEAPTPTFGVDFYLQVAEAQTKAACDAATAHSGICVDYLHIFGGPDGTADPAKFLGPDHAHPGDLGIQAVADELLRLGLPELGLMTAASTAAPSTTDDAVLPGQGWILYQAHHAFEQVTLIRPDGGGEHSLNPNLPGTHQTNPDWSPDGNQITFIVTENDGTEDLWLSGIDGTDAKRVLDCQEPCRWIDDPSWMPDGHSIVFSRTSEVDGSGVHTLELFDVDTGEVRVVLGPFDTQFTSGARPAPDGRSVVFELVHKAGPEVEADVKGVTLSIADLTSTPASVAGITDPALFAETADWSPDGSLIVYAALAAAGDNAHDLYTVHPDGSGLTRVTNLAASGGNATHPTFTADGAGLIFAATIDGFDKLARVDLDGSNLGPATSDGYHQGHHPRDRPGP